MKNRRLAVRRFLIGAGYDLRCGVSTLVRGEPRASEGGA